MRSGVVGRNVAIVDSVVGIVMGIARAPVWLYPPALIVFAVATAWYSRRQLRRELPRE